MASDMQTTDQAQPALGRTLIHKLAERFGVAPAKLLPTLRDTCFRVDKGEVTDAQMMQLLVVADQYDLNPFTRELFAFQDKWGRVVPCVSVDGWSRIINEHPQMDGVEYVYSDEIVQMPGAKPCPAWCEAVFYRKDRKVPIRVREYLDETYRSGSVPGPWQSHTKRFLRHKAHIQGARIAFGFAGIYDEDEAARIIEQAKAPTARPVQQDKAELAAKLKALAQEHNPLAPNVDGAAEAVPVEVERPALDVDPDTGEVLPPELQSHPVNQGEQ
jgi:phage recombination protein Bet